MDTSGLSSLIFKHKGLTARGKDQAAEYFFEAGPAQHYHRPVTSLTCQGARGCGKRPKAPVEFRFNSIGGEGLWTEKLVIKAKPRRGKSLVDSYLSDKMVLRNEKNEGQEVLNRSIGGPSSSQPLMPDGIC